MSQAPSTGSAVNCDDDLVGVPSDPSGTATSGSSAPSGEAGSDGRATVPAEAELSKESVSSVSGISLRGTTRGLEILISGTPSTAVLAARLTELFAEAPSFFAGSTARVAIEGQLPSGALACLEAVATQFEVQIVEIGPVVARRRRSTVPAVLRPEDVPQVQLAEGTGPIADEAAPRCGGEPEPAHVAPPEAPAEAAPIEVAPVAAAPSDATSVAAAPESAPPDAAPIEVAPADAVPSDATSMEAALEGAPPDVAPVTLAGPLAGAPPAGAPPAAVSPAAVSLAPVSTTATPTDTPPAAGAPSTAPPAAGAPSTAPPAAGAPSTASPPAVAPRVAHGDELASAVAAIAAGPLGPRLVIGPVRSGMIVDHVGHVIVIGDVNPGAEVRAEGSIIVLGRLRGVAHAAIGREAGCIIALSLQPQQLRIGRMVARAADADRPSGGAEIAYATGETIVVERFVGRLPSGLAASM